MALGYEQIPMPDHLGNGDEESLPGFIGNFSKGLPHNALGEVFPGAYKQLLAALTSGNPADFEAIPSGCADLSRRNKLVDPQAGLAYEVEGMDSHQLLIPPPPAFSSAQEAGEAIELYWMALARDVPFTTYDSDPVVGAAAAELSGLTDFRGPKVSGRVTSAALFRGITAGDLAGPYVSQFLLKPIVYGAQTIPQQIRTVLPGIDYMTRYADWLDVQNGYLPNQGDQFDSTPRYIRNGRDLAPWVHMDALYQAYLNAALILLGSPSQGGMFAPFDPGNPYLSSANQQGFGTFGPPHILTLVTEVATRALKAVWFQKWFVHRRLRPEEFGGRVQNTLSGPAGYPLHADLAISAGSPGGALNRVFSANGTYLLPQAYPEGAPEHPAYGAGHATVAGACSTILKAWFDESFVITEPVVPSADGLSLVPYTGSATLTVGGELNKLAANIAMGRNFAGIHWRTDYSESLKLGEAVSISILRDQRATFNQRFGGFTLTKFDGTTVNV